MKKQPIRKVRLRTFRGPGAPGGWHVCARVCDRHGHIKQQFDGRAFMRRFRAGASFLELAAYYEIRSDVAEEIVRQMLAKEYA